MVAAIAIAVGVVVWRIRNFDSRQKRNLVKQTMKNVFFWLEDKRLVRRYPAFVLDYHRDYPGLGLLEDNYPTVRDECMKLLGMKERLTDISAMGGNYTQGGIHAIQWKSFMFKSGEFIEENCRHCPETTAILRKIPGVYTAFFSILDPHQYVFPHWGYYRGFWRFHLGVIIPDDNEDGKCWIRINDDPSIRQPEDRDCIEGGEVYHWKNGEGILFDDTYLHDAKNESDEVRVVLWLDVRKKWPFVANWLNRLVLKIVYADASVKRIRENAVIRD